MANNIKEALNVDGMGLYLFTGGMSNIGFGITGTWVGTIRFFGSFDGASFIPIYVTPFASGTTVLSTTANGSWFVSGQNYMAVKVVFTRTSGTAIVALAASLDSSFQDALLASTSKYVSQSASGGGSNTVTVAAQANRAWRVRSASVGFSVAASAAVLFTISDGGSATIWEGYVPPSTNAISGGGTFAIPLPPPSNTPGLADGGVVGTPGNTMVLTLAAPGGSVVSKINAEMAAA